MLHTPRTISRDHAQNDRGGYQFQVDIDTDEPAELKYNATPGPLRGLADWLMERNDIAPVPDYDVVIEGTDAAHIVNNVLAEIEIGVQPDYGTKTRVRNGSGCHPTTSSSIISRVRSAFGTRSTSNHL